MTMSRNQTLRNNRRERFTVIDRAVFDDEGLSYGALGLLAYLLSRPDDWSFTSTSLSANRPEGRDRVRNLLRELEDHGYLRRHRERAPTGRYTYVTEVSETPGQTSDGISGPDRPAQVDPALLLKTEDLELKTEKETPPTRKLAVVGGSRKLKENPLLERAHILADAYWQWHVRTKGVQPLTKLPAIRARFEECLIAGWTEREIKAAAVLVRYTITRSSLTAARAEAQRASGGGNGEQWVVPL